MAEQDNVAAFAPATDSRWLLEVDGFDPALEPTIEAVLALVNGYGGTRAAMEEGSGVSRPASFVAGVFDTSERPQAPELDEAIPEIVVAPNWSRVRIVVEDQELRLDAPGVELLGQRRVLDIRQGVLLREWRVRDGAGRITSLRSLRFASLADRHALVQLLMIMPENYGRDHHPRAFSIFMAGGGVKSGMVYGETDDFGYNITENPVHVHDFQATVMHLMGIDHEKLTYKHLGRRYRLTDVHGRVVKDVLA